MAQAMLTRDNTNKVVGFGNDDKKRYNIFRRFMRKLEPGELVRIQWFIPRSPMYHRMHMRMLRDVFESQDVFEDYDIMRGWIQVGAGHCEWVPAVKHDGVCKLCGGHVEAQLLAIPKSIAYEKLDDADFKVHHEKVIMFLRSDHALEVLWQHLSMERRVDMMETILSRFERD